jgi:hypothetical protein
MSKLSKFIVSLLRFAKPEMLIADYEWAEACIKDGQFIGQLVVTPSFYLPGAQQELDYLVRVRLTRPRGENVVPSLKSCCRRVRRCSFSKFVFSSRVKPSVDSSKNKSQCSACLHFQAQYWLLGPLLLGRFGRAEGSSGLDNEAILQALSSEEKSNT